HHGRHDDRGAPDRSDRYASPACLRPRPYCLVVLHHDRLDSGRVAGDDRCGRSPPADRPRLSLRAAQRHDLATLPPERRTEGAGFYNLSRSIGSGVGILGVSSLLISNTQANHAEIVQHVTAVNPIFSDPFIAHVWNPLAAAGRAALDAMITEQAQIIAY